MRPDKPIKLAPLRPNLGIAASYRRKLEAMVAEMQADLKRAILDQYEDRPPVMARDASPSAEMIALMRFLKANWQGRFDRLSEDLARYFVHSTATRNDAALKAMLRRAGFTVRFTMTKAQQDVITAAIGEIVSLIRSIASQHLSDVEGLVLRSASAGMDLAVIARGLQGRYDVTKKRAAFIALDQSRKATSALERTRQVELGVKAIWLHSAGGREPRPTHVANSGKEYDPAEGWLDPALGYRIWPGTEINCRCVSRAVIFPGRMRAAA